MLPIGSKCTDRDALHKVGVLIHYSRYFGILRREDGRIWRVPKERLVRWSHKRGKSKNNGYNQSVETESPS